MSENNSEVMSSTGILNDNSFTSTENSNKEVTKAKSSVRKVILTLIFLSYLMAFPPFNSLYNKPGIIFGLPIFMFGLFINALIPVILIFILYNYEKNQKK